MESTHGEELDQLERLVKAHDADAIDGQRALELCSIELAGLPPPVVEKCAHEALRVLDHPERLGFAQMLQNLLTEGGLQDAVKLGVRLARMFRDGLLGELLGGELLQLPVVKLVVAGLAVQGGIEKSGAARSNVPAP